MTLLEQLVAIGPAVLVLGAAGTLLTTSARMERRASEVARADRAAEEIASVLQAIVDRRAPGRSIVPVAGGFAVRTVRAEGAACGSDSTGTLVLRRRTQVRLPVAGDSVLHPDTLAADRWHAHLITGVAAAGCPDGAPAWRLSLSDSAPLPDGAELLISEWLDIGLTGGPDISLAVRPRGAATPRQPAVGAMPGVGARLELLSASGTALTPTDTVAAVLVELRHAAVRRGAASRGLRLPVDGDAAW